MMNTSAKESILMGLHIYRLFCLGFGSGLVSACQHLRQLRFL
ncbi:MAG: hypothetical protein NZM34_13695 [Bernardetiaceae bacterium]|nr:hypothetical protein [Bernardetiaceae bacterium]